MNYTGQELGNKPGNSGHNMNHNNKRISLKGKWTGEITKIMNYNAAHNTNNYNGNDGGNRTRLDTRRIINVGRDQNFVGIKHKPDENWYIDSLLMVINFHILEYFKITPSEISWYFKDEL